MQSVQFINKAGMEHSLSRPVIFLPGWGFDGRVVELAETELSWMYPTVPLGGIGLIDDLLVFLEQRKIYRIDLVGWSMGANLALDFSLANPERVSGLFLLSIRQSWPSEEIDQIRKELAAKPQEFLIGFYRKCFLGHKGAYDRFVAGLQDQYLSNMDLPLLQAGLDYLEQINTLSAPDCEVHCIHGRRDLIAPVSEMGKVAGCRTTVLENSGHAVFVGKDFSLPEKQRKKAIRKRFSKAALTYDEHADVQKELAQKLAADVVSDAAVHSILEIGCGTGNYTALLAKQYSAADILAIDFSQTMIEAAHKKLSGFPQVTFVCEDGETFLATTRNSFDLITANATLQWFDDIDAAFGHVGRLLGKEGCFRGAIFGPQTLAELGQGLERIFDRQVRLPSSRFLSKEELHGMLDKHFTMVRIDEWCVNRRYKSLRDLLTHIKKTGTGGWHPTPLVFTRDRLHRLDAWFQEHYGCYQVTYQAFIIRCKK